MRRALLSGVVLALLSLAATADAQPNVSASNAAARARAASWFKNGVERTRANDYEGARTSFAAAYAIVPSTDILWNLGVAERRSGKPIDALAHLKSYVAQPNGRGEGGTRMKLNFWQWLGVVLLLIAIGFWINRQMMERTASEAVQATPGFDPSQYGEEEPKTEAAATAPTP